MLNEIAVELTSILDLDPLLERIGQLLRRLIDYQMFTIMLLDEKGEALITPLRLALRLRARPRCAASPSPAAWSAPRSASGALINVPDVRKDPRYLPMNPETRSELIVPLFYKGSASSACSISNTRAPITSTKTTSAR